MPISRLAGLFAAVTIALAAVLPPCAHAQAKHAQSAVLVTGASSGIGLNITETLAAEGHFVYAGARSDEDIARLSAMENVEGLRLDVTKPADIEAAVRHIEAAGRGLHGVVNNAGVAILGPLIETELAELEWLFDVNVYGPYRITRAFAPLLIESKGRVVNISSINGVASTPFAGIYSMSKYALEAYSDALAAELATLDVRVSVVEPGPFDSDIRNKIAEDLAERSVDIETSRFSQTLREMATSVSAQDDLQPPDAVSAAVVDALYSDAPQARYLVSPTAAGARFATESVMRLLVQINEGHEHALDRDELVALLDEMLAR